LCQFKPYEIKLIDKIVKKYPYSEIHVLSVDRERMDYSCNIYDEDEMLDFCDKPGKGELSFRNLDKNVKVAYAIDPDKNSMGYRKEPYTEYNDSYYSGHDSVLVYALCVQLKKYM
jgi:hypothetical protein